MANKWTSSRPTDTSGEKLHAKGPKNSNLINRGISHVHTLDVQNRELQIIVYCTLRRSVCVPITQENMDFYQKTSGRSKGGSNMLDVLNSAVFIILSKKTRY
jgi:hypothetical protein